MNLCDSHSVFWLLIGLLIGFGGATALLVRDSRERRSSTCSNAGRFRWTFQFGGFLISGENLMARITTLQSIAFSVTGKTAVGTPGSLAGCEVKSSDESVAVASGSLSADGSIFSGIVRGVAPGVVQIIVDDPQADGSDPAVSAALEVVAPGVATLELAFGEVTDTPQPSA